MTDTVAFDPKSPETLADPGRAYGALGAACPFHHHKTAEHDFWILSDHAEIKDEILQDNPVWSFRWGNAAKDSISDVGFKTDPPFHNQFRAAVQRGLTPPQLKRYEAHIEAITAELIDAMLARPEASGDFYELFALPLPARMMCLMLGAPEDRALDYKRWSDTLQFLIFHDMDAGSYETVLKEIYPHFTALIDERRRMLADAGVTEPALEHLGTVLPDDFMSRGLVSRVDGRLLTHEEVLNICLAFLTGGQETTTNLIGNLMARLLEEPARWEAVKADPGLIETAIEESLRYDPPVLAHFRTSLCPVQMHGEQLPDHAKLMFSIAGANRDAKVFGDPDQFKLERPVAEARKHLAFGSGVHFCMGAPVARLEAKIALRELIRRLPNLRATEAPSERVRTWMYWGRSKQPVAWG